MCERYVLPHQPAAEMEFLPGQAWWKFSPKFNVGPTQYVPTIRMHAGSSEGVMMRWGLIPAWAEGQPIETSTVSVEFDELDRSPVYRMPWLSGQRCILPMAGFFTWRLTAAKYRQPYYVQPKGRAMFGVAAVWDRSTLEEEDDVIESCSVINVPVNDLMARLGRTRMPAILRRRDYAKWLSATPAEAKALLHPYHAAWMQAHPVSPRINSTAIDDPGLIEPVT